MGVATLEEIKKSIKKGKCPIWALRDKDNDDDAIKAWLTQHRDVALANRQQCKTNRPWDIVDFSKLLPADQPWLGWEYETGTDDQPTYHKMINFLFDMNHVAVDREGSGEFPFEIAFPPEAMSSYEDGSTAFQQYCKFLKDNAIEQAMNPTTYTRRAIGMHVNISTPLSRKKGIKYATSDALCADLGMGEKEEIELFGRYQRHWSLASARGPMMEFKMFASTSDTSVIEKYMEVAKRLPALIDAYIKGLHAKNMYAYLRGDDLLETA